MKMYSPGPLPVIREGAEQIRLIRTINRIVEWDSSQCKLSPGERILALIMNLLTDRQALYRMPEFFQQADVQNLFGEEIQPEDFNDDALGRALDKVHEAGALKVASEAVLEAIRREGVSLDVVHSDTTSVSVQGEYEDDGSLDITYGHSKDHRPDLKQFKMGLGVNSHGVVCLGDVLDGNQSDKSWNGPFIRRLATVYGDREPLPVYVADSAAVVESTLSRLDEKDMDFISRMPHTYGLPDKLIEAAWESGEWEQIGALSEQDDAAKYKLQAFTEEVHGQPYRLIVVHSTTLDGRKERAIDNELDRTEKQLKKALKELESREFACEADAQEAIQQFNKSEMEDAFELEAEVTEQTRRKKRERPGRPPNDYEPEVETVWGVQGTIRRHQTVIQERKEKASCFVLITSLQDEEKWPHRRVLDVYKNQTRVEQSFRFIKDPKKVGPMYLESPERIEALGYVLLLALLVYSLIERRVRRALETEEAPMKLAGGKESFRPTGRRVLERFENMMVARAGPERSLPDNLEVPRRVLELLGMSVEVYGVKTA